MGSLTANLKEAPTAPTTRFSRRSFLKLSAAAAAGLGLYAGEISRHEISVEERTIILKRLPDAFRGMRIVQISDFHYTEYTESFFIRDIVRHVNRLKPDMVVLTGDFVSYGPMPFSFARRHAPECGALLSEITCPLRYGILGNHDCTVGAKYVVGALEENGIPMLVNQSVALERDGKRLWLTGLASMSYGPSEARTTIPKASIHGDEPVIVLAHEPDIMPYIARFNADLMLSGHTHGGQIRLPFMPLFYLPAWGKIYVEGLFQHGRTQLYVNRGVGAVGIPFRFRCPPEITVLTLA